MIFFPWDTRCPPSIVFDKESRLLSNTLLELKININATYYTANIYVQRNYSGNWDTRKKCTLYKYLLFALQYISVNFTVNHCKSVLHLSHYTWRSNVKSTVENGTPVKSVKITLNIFAVYCRELSEK